MERAKMEAEDHEHPYITAEDILLAILAERSCSAYVCIASLTSNFGAIETEIEKRLKRIRDGNVKNPVFVGAQTVLRFAEKESKNNKREMIVTDDLLCAILASPESHACRLLSKHNLSLKVFRAF